MRKYQKEMFVCFVIYIVLFVGAAISPQAVLNTSGIRILFMQTMTRTNLIIPLLANTIVMTYYITKGFWHSKRPF